ncbi:sodium/hydrogen exchanger 3 isoform X4 [Toxorhynchites rutilus septentrionalis]|uniref:sodium/hydrogen exchanger 3 isoform X4 n=1 Tax=Toxorhynchites rutilus septentrionalis TaxID=329112 RepID=UPI00247A2AE1|nr:sodium/hydrogen exchanger 3 isoform X4 [Toxorhynchites rutilus septentrionalis]
MALSLQQEVNLSRRACGIRSGHCRRSSSDAQQQQQLNHTLGANETPAESIHEIAFNQKYAGISEIGSDVKEKLLLESVPQSVGYGPRAAEVRNNSRVQRKMFNCDLIAQIFLIVKVLVVSRFRFNASGIYKRPVRSSRSNSFSMYLAKMGACVVLVSFLLSDSGFALARPNRAGNEPESVAAASEHLVGADLVTPNPGMHFGSLGPSESQLKRSAELASIISSTVPSDGSGGTSKQDETHSSDGGHGEGHEVERYPVAQVEFSRVETPFVIGVWILSASIAKIGFHMTPKLSKIFPESCLLIVVGVIIGVLLRYATNLHVSPLTPNTFFFYMLPPIILDAGYFMPNRMFFDNIGTILLMAVIGTIFNIGTIGMSLWACSLTGMFGVSIPFLHVFLFASLISAVDPVAVLAVFEEIHVNEVLYIVVFGESLLNDAVTVVMYHMFESYNEIGSSQIQVIDIVSGVASFFVVALGGTIIGVIWGFLTGLVTRFTDHVRVIEPIFIFVMAYLAYLNAEIFHMSGILAITFCGITMKNYVEQNVSHKSHTTIKYALKMLSSSSETIIFMFLGVATVNNRHIWNTWFVLLTIVFCSVFRIIGVLILSALANRFRIHKLSKVDQFVMSYGGLRGAVAFALVLLVSPEHIPLQPMFVTTTIAVIYFTVFLQGITIKPLVRILNVKRSSKRKPTMNERIHERFMDHMMAGIEDIVGKTGNYNIRDKFKRFDNRFIRPYLIKNLQGPEPKILETYSKLTMRDAMDYMRRNPSTIGQMSGTESMSALFRNYTGVFGGRCGTSFLGTCPSFSNLENSTRNLDMQELDYNPSKKDLTDAKIHHLLSVELKPYRRVATHTHRRLSYSRHAVDDRDLTTQQVNYKMQMNIRRMISEKKHHKRSKRVKDGKQQNHVSFPEFAQNGTAKQFANDYINEVLHEDNEEDERLATVPSDDWDGGGLTFTAKSSPESPANVRPKSASASDHGANGSLSTSAEISNSKNNSSLIAQITSLPGFDPTKARIVKHVSSKFTSSSSSNTNISNTGNSSDTTVVAPTRPPERPERLLPTAAETFLPWRRDKSYQSFVDENGGESAKIDKRASRDLKDTEAETRVTTPTAIEAVLPWKRGDEDGGHGAIKQNEFPSWASNKEYLAYNSPSATFLGLFRRESSGSGGIVIGGVTDSETSTPVTATTPIGRTKKDKRSASIAGYITIDGSSDINGDPLGVSRAAVPHANAFPVTASHRRNNRRGSLLELSGYNTTDFVDFTIVSHRRLSMKCCEAIPEENYTKSLPERDSYGARRGPALIRASGTPKSANNRKSTNPQTTALLSSSSTDSEEEEEEDEDCGDEQHPI